MKLKKTVLVSLLCAAIFTLSACSTPGKKADSDASAMNNANENASAVQTAGLGDEDNFGSEDNQGTRKGTLSQRTYYFDFDKSDVREQDKPAILANANKLAANPDKKVIVEGHTDPRGSREYNVALGERRSHAVADLLKSNGVNANQIHEVSYGAQRLASSGHTDTDYQQDRRAKIVYQN